MFPFRDLPPRLSRGGLDTRAEVARILGRFVERAPKHVLRALACVALAAIVAFVPGWDDLPDAARSALFILVLAAGLWITEAIPAFAVGILVMALGIALLGRPGGVHAETARDWEGFVVVWGDPLIWLFFGGFVLAAGARETGLDRRLATHVLPRFGTRPAALLLGVMSITFVFSMFMSNTATAAMMMAIVAPVVAALDRKDPFTKALLLGVSVSATLGGMGTVIGSPPNAIAVGVLGSAPGQQPDFLQWMLLGMPPAVLLAVACWLLLARAYRSAEGRVDIARLAAGEEVPDGAARPAWRYWLVAGTFFVTVVLWMTGSVHGLPSAVISFVPITVFTATGILGARGIRELDWDVLLLMAGGLALGVAVSDTGLAEWLIRRVPLTGVGLIGTSLVMAYLCAGLSNLMSNTAAANILVPLGMAAFAGQEAKVVVPIALAASAALCLPISTPPNAIVYASGRLDARDFLRPGVLVGAIGPLVAVLWSTWILDRLTG